MQLPELDTSDVMNMNQSVLEFQVLFTCYDIMHIYNNFTQIKIILFTTSSGGSASLIIYQECFNPKLICSSIVFIKCT